MLCIVIVPLKPSGRLRERRTILLRQMPEAGSFLLSKSSDSYLTTVAACLLSFHCVFLPMFTATAPVIDRNVSRARLAEKLEGKQASTRATKLTRGCLGQWKNLPCMEPTCDLLKMFANVPEPMTKVSKFDCKRVAPCNARAQGFLPSVTCERPKWVNGVTD